MRYAAVFAALLISAAPAAAEAPLLSLPIDCTLGKTCYIQNYVDRDPGPGVSDFRCGSLSYDGHKGVDFGLPTLADMHRGVNVLAPAPGRIRAFRDGVADVGTTEVTQGRECGNGVVISHTDGWEIQVCHLKSGSIIVQNGQQVERGDILGQVGLSGKTQFPHVHLSLRHKGEKVDPFDLSEYSTCGQGGKSLWQDPPTYFDGGLLDIGFSPGVPDYDMIKAGTAHQSELASDSAGLVLYGFGYSALKGDEMVLRITGPDGVLISQTATLEKNRAQFFRAAGKRLTAAHWPVGRYVGTVRLVRNGQTLARREIEMHIR